MPKGNTGPPVEGDGGNDGPATAPKLRRPGAKLTLFSKGTLVAVREDALSHGEVRIARLHQDVYQGTRVGTQIKVTWYEWKDTTNVLETGPPGSIVRPTLLGQVMAIPSSDRRTVMLDQASTEQVEKWNAELAVPSRQSDQAPRVAPNR